MNNKILLAKVVNTKGLKGEIKLKSYTHDLLSIKDYVLLDCNEVKYKLLNAYLKNDLVIATVEGINTKEDAETLIGKRLYIYRESLPSPEDNSYYIVDLIGLNVLNSDRIFVGVVKDMYNFGAGDILEVEFKNKKTFMFPFNDETILNIDIENNELIINSIYKEYM